MQEAARAAHSAMPAGYSPTQMYQLPTGAHPSSLVGGKGKNMQAEAVARASMEAGLTG